MMHILRRWFFCHGKQKPDDYINVTIELDDMDITSAETKATYDEIKKYVSEHNAGMKVSNLYISQVKRKCGIETRFVKGIFLIRERPAHNHDRALSK